MQQMHAGEHLVPRVVRSQEPAEQGARPADDHDGEDGRDHEISDQGPPLNPEHSGDRAAPEERHGQRVDGRDERADPRVDHAAGENRGVRVDASCLPRPQATSTRPPPACDRHVPS
jgi:hypothetical protein